MSDARVRPVAHYRCSGCFLNWEDHLPFARERLRSAEPGRFFVNKYGAELPTLDSLMVAEYVTTADCHALALRGAL
jgi:hypothetical protein